MAHDQFFDWRRLHSSNPFPNVSNVRPRGTWWNVTPGNMKKFEIRKGKFAPEERRRTNQASLPQHSCARRQRTAVRTYITGSDKIKPEANREKDRPSQNKEFQFVGEET